MLAKGYLNNFTLIGYLWHTKFLVWLFQISSECHFSTIPKAGDFIQCPQSQDGSRMLSLKLYKLLKAEHLRAN